MLAGGRPAADRRGLADLLSAASGPVQPRELRGGEAPLAVFMQGPRRHASPIKVRRRSALARVLGGGLTAKLAAATALFALGGAAVAAETGVLPAPAQQVVHDILGGVGVPPPPPRVAASPRADDDDRADPGPTTKPSSTKDDDDQGRAHELCREYRAYHGKTPDPELAKRLARLAGDAAKIERFCAGVLAEPGSPRSPEPDPTEEEE